MQFIYHFYNYKLTNHLGNVLATISARPRLIYDNQTFEYKEADVMSVSDYYPIWHDDAFKALEF